MPKSKIWQNMAKIGGFSPPEGDTINRSRRNLASKRRPRVCYSTPNLALIGKRGSIQEPPKDVKICPKLWFLPIGSRHNEHIQMKFGGKCRPWVCSNTPNLALIGIRGSVQERPKLSKFAQNCGFWSVSYTHLTLPTIYSV